MATLGTLEVILSANTTRFVTGITKASAALSKFGTRTRMIGQDVIQLGKSLTFRVSAPLAAIGGLAIRSFATFDAAMTQSLAIMGNVSETLKKQMVDAAREMARVTTFSAAQAAESFFFLASAGLDAESSILALPVVAKFAQAGMFDMATATDLLTDAQSALGRVIRDDAIANMREMVKVSDVLVKANTLANATVQQFSEALTSEAGAAIKSFNVDMEQGVAVLAAFADQGIKGNVAGSLFSRMLRLMTKAVRENKDIFKQHEISVFNSAGELNDMADIIGDFEGALRGMSTEMKIATLDQLGFKARVQQAILPLIGTSEAIREYTEGLNAAAGITDEIARKQLRAFTNQVIILRNQLSVAAARVVDLFEPALRKTISTIQELVKRFDNLTDRTRKFVGIVLVLGAALGPVILTLGLLIQLFGFALTAIAALGPRILAVVVAFRRITPIALIISVALGKVIAGFRGSTDQALEFRDKAAAVFRKVRQEVRTFATLIKITFLDATAQTRMWVSRSISELAKWAKAAFFAATDWWENGGRLVLMSLIVRAGATFKAFVAITRVAGENVREIFRFIGDNWRTLMTFLQDTAEVVVRNLGKKQFWIRLLLGIFEAHKEILTNTLTLWAGFFEQLFILTRKGVGLQFKLLTDPVAALEELGLAGAIVAIGELGAELGAELGKNFDKELEALPTLEFGDRLDLKGFKDAVDPIFSEMNDRLKDLSGNVGDSIAEGIKEGFKAGDILARFNATAKALREQTRASFEKSISEFDAAIAGLLDKTKDEITTAPPQFAAALERGTAEARTAFLEGRGSPKETQIEKNTRKEVDLSKQQLRELKNITRTIATLGASEVVTIP